MQLCIAVAFVTALIYFFRNIFGRSVISRVQRICKKENGVFIKKDFVFPEISDMHNFSEPKNTIHIPETNYTHASLPDAPPFVEEENLPCSFSCAPSDEIGTTAKLFDFVNNIYQDIAYDRLANIKIPHKHYSRNVLVFEHSDNEIVLFHLVDTETGEKTHSLNIIFEMVEGCYNIVSSIFQDNYFVKGGCTVFNKNQTIIFLENYF